MEGGSVKFRLIINILTVSCALLCVGMPENSQQNKFEFVIAT